MKKYIFFWSSDWEPSVFATFRNKYFIDSWWILWWIWIYKLKNID